VLQATSTMQQQRLNNATTTTQQMQHNCTCRKVWV